MRVTGVVLLALLCAKGGVGGFLDSQPPHPQEQLLPHHPSHEEGADSQDEAFNVLKELLASYSEFNNGTTFYGGKSTRMSPLARAYEEYINVAHLRAAGSSEEKDQDEDSNSDELQILRNSTGGPKRRQKRQAAPAPCMTPSTSHCGNFVNSRYRTTDGTCNNPNNVWGAAGRAFNRLLEDAYQDGFDAPRGGFGTNLLPNPRQVSINVHPDSSVVNPRITNMVPIFGQFLDHDITMTPETGSPCCSQPNSNPANCWPIQVGGDPFFSQFTNCLDFTRSTPCAQNNQREQSNANTAFIDGSMIYGSSAQRSNNLRTFSGGQMKTNPSFRGFLPSGQAVGAQVQGDFAAGDDRVNENPALAVLQTLWLKEHNRVAAALNNQVRGTWNDERLYQEARRIVIAELQHVTYNEYLPIILGPNNYGQNNLGSSTWSTYSSSVDPTIINEFATAAYRFGHSLIAGVFNLFNAQDQVVDSYQLATEYFQSRQIVRNSGEGFDMILRGLLKQNAPEMDRFVTTGVTRFLFKPQNQNFGSDLVARNIQRGRDHGLRSWNDYRVACGLSSIAAASWASAPAGVDATGWSQASRLYAKPADIDLFVGGLLELPVSGGLSGPTFTCIKGIQFNRLKFGDRYFFTHNLGTGFTGAQLDNLVQRRLSDIICDNSQQPSAQANAFLVGGQNIPCGTGRPQLNFALFAQ